MVIILKAVLKRAAFLFNGEPTGENTNDFGETYKFELPNSKIQIQLTTTFDLGADCEPQKNHPVIPDHIVKPQLGVTDNAIQYILRQSKSVH